MLTRRAFLAGLAAVAAPQPRAAEMPAAARRIRRFEFLDPDGVGVADFVARAGRAWDAADWARASAALETAQSAYEQDVLLDAARLAREDERLAALPAGSLRDWLRAEVHAFAVDRDAGFARAVALLDPYEDAFLAWRAAWFEVGRMRLRLCGEPDLAVHGLRHPVCGRRALPFASSAARRFLSAALGGLADAWPRAAAYAAQIRRFRAGLR
jgi:hypothetical protein